MSQIPAPAASESFSGLAKIAMWFVLAAVLWGMFGQNGGTEVQASEAAGTEALSGDPAVESRSASEGLDPFSPEAKNAKAFLRSYYAALTESDQRQTALNTMLTPEFRSKVDPANVTAFWGIRERASVSEVVPLSSTRYRANVTHEAASSDLEVQRMEFSLVCALRLANGAICPEDKLLIAGAVHLNREH